MAEALHQTPEVHKEGLVSAGEQISLSITPADVAGLAKDSMQKIIHF